MSEPEIPFQHDHQSSMYNYRTGEYEWVDSREAYALERASDYIPQLPQAQLLFRTLIQRGETVDQAMLQVLLAHLEYLREPSQEPTSYCSPSCGTDASPPSPGSGGS